MKSGLIRALRKKDNSVYQVTPVTVFISIIFTVTEIYLTLPYLTPCKLELTSIELANWKLAWQLRIGDICPGVKCSLFRRTI